MVAYSKNGIFSKKLRKSKGQIISKRFFSGRGFAQKTNENTSHTSKNEFIRSFFGRILGLTVSFRNYLTFSSVKISGRFFKLLWTVQKGWTLCDVFSFVFWANPRPEKNRFEII